MFQSLMTFLAYSNLEFQMQPAEEETTPSRIDCVRVLHSHSITHRIFEPLTGAIPYSVGKRAD